MSFNFPAVGSPGSPTTAECPALESAITHPPASMPCARLAAVLNQMATYVGVAAVMMMMMMVMM